MLRDFAAPVNRNGGTTRNHRLRVPMSEPVVKADRGTDRWDGFNPYLAIAVLARLFGVSGVEGGLGRRARNVWANAV